MTCVDAILIYYLDFNINFKNFIVNFILIKRFSVFVTSVSGVIHKRDDDFYNTCTLSIYHHNISNYTCL